MAQIPLDITSLENAVRSLEEIVGSPKTVIVRDATIQRFEYTFELLIKFLMRILETMPIGMNVDHLPFRDMIRIAAEGGLISNPNAWFDYRDARNITSHAYDEKRLNLFMRPLLFFPLTHVARWKK